MALKQESLVGVYLPSQQAPPLDLFAYARERRQGEKSLGELARQVKASTPEELRAATAAEQRRLDEQVATLYSRAHESSMAFLERSAWLRQADGGVAAMEGAIADVARRVEALAGIVDPGTNATT